MFDIRRIRRESQSAWHDMRHRLIWGGMAALLIFVLPAIIGA